VTRALINAAGAALQAIRLDGEHDLIVSFGAHAPSADCPTNGSVSVTIKRGSDEATSEAVSLDDAIHLARGKLDRIAAKREAERKAG
jgi:hypothetical protein